MHFSDTGEGPVTTEVDEGESDMLSTFEGVGGSWWSSAFWFNGFHGREDGSWLRGYHGGFSIYIARNAAKNRVRVGSELPYVLDLERVKIFQKEQLGSCKKSYKIDRFALYFKEAGLSIP